MLRNTIALFVVVALVAPVVRADDKDKAIEKDKKALQGVWLVESAQQDGKEVPKNVREQSEFCLYAVKVTDDKFQVAWLKDKTDYGNAVAFKLDPSATPKVIEWPEGNRKAAVAYAIDGDKLTICFHAGDNPDNLFDSAKLPTKLETKPDDKRYLFVLKRSKK